MAAQRITFCVFKPREGFYLNDMITNMQKINTSDRYCIISEQGTVFSRGIYYWERPQTESRYNIQSGESEKVTFIKQFSLKFEIDISKNSIMVWGNKNLATTLLTELSTASNNTIVIDEVHIDFKKVLITMGSENNIQISRLRIVDVPIEYGVLATCSVNAADMPKAFMQKYVDNITQISFAVCDNADTISVTLHSSGALIVYKEMESISDEIIDTLKGLIG